MSDRASKRCVACTADTPRVAPDEVKRLLTTLPGYKADMLVGSISKVYEFDDYDFICSAKIEALVRR